MLPMWLASQLAGKEVDAVKMFLPNFYSAKIREDLLAGAMAVNLYDLCPYYFRFGMLLCTKM